MKKSDRFKAKVFFEFHTIVGEGVEIISGPINIGDMLFLEEEVTNQDVYPDDYYTIGFNVLNESTGEKLYIDLCNLYELKEGSDIWV